MRSFSAFLLVVLATLVAPLAVATTWVTERVDDRQEYVDAVAPLADDPAVRQVMADAAAAAAVAALQQHGVGAAEQAELLYIAYGMKGEIVGR